jgi:hypothetical protein
VDNNGNYREGWEKQVPAFRHTTKRQLLFDRALFNRAPFYYSLKRLFPNFIVRPGVDHVFICLLLILQKVKYLCCIRIGVEQSGNFCSGHIRDALICMDKPQPSCATAWLISCVSPGQGRRLTTDALQHPWRLCPRHLRLPTTCWQLKPISVDRRSWRVSVTSSCCTPLLVENPVLCCEPVLQYHHEIPCM